MDELFINTYIEKANEKISILGKNELILQTQLELAQKIINTLKEENASLHLEIEKFSKRKEKKLVETEF